MSWAIRSFPFGSFRSALRGVLSVHLDVPSGRAEALPSGSWPCRHRPGPKAPPPAPKGRPAASAPQSRGPAVRFRDQRRSADPGEPAVRLARTPDFVALRRRAEGWPGVDPVSCRFPDDPLGRPPYRSSGTEAPSDCRFRLSAGPAARCGRNRLGPEATFRLLPVRLSRPKPVGPLLSGNRGPRGGSVKVRADARRVNPNAWFFFANFDEFSRARRRGLARTPAGDANYTRVVLVTALA